MPLINKAAVIFISQGLQTHLWCAAWQQKLVKNLPASTTSPKCSDQPITATSLKVQDAASPPLQGIKTGQSRAPALIILLFLSPRCASKDGNP